MTGAKETRSKEETYQIQKERTHWLSQGGVLEYVTESVRSKQQTVSCIFDCAVISLTDRLRVGSLVGGRHALSCCCWVCRCALLSLFSHTARTEF